MNTLDEQQCGTAQNKLTSTRRGLATGVALVVVASIAIPSAPQALAAQTTSQPPTQTGFVKPFAGAPRYESAAPTQAQSARQINQPLGRKRADAIAAKIGFRKSKTFTKKQYRQLTTGRGVGGNVDAVNVKAIETSGSDQAAWASFV